VDTFRMKEDTAHVYAETMEELEHVARLEPQHGI
jgi:hypothetical protein